MYDELTPFQKMLLPPFVLLEERFGRGLMWHFIDEVGGAFWIASEKFISAELSDLHALHTAGFIDLEIHALQRHAQVTLKPAAHLAVHEQFQMTPKDYVLTACYVAASGKPDGLFYRILAERYAIMEKDAFEAEWTPLVQKNVITQMGQMGMLGMLCTFTKIGVAMVERNHQKPKVDQPLPTMSISNSPGAVIQHAHQSTASIHNTTGMPGADVVAMIEACKKSLTGLNDDEKQQVEDTLDDLGDEVKSPTRKSSRIRAFATHLANLIPVGKATVTLIGEVTAICRSCGLAEDEILKIVHHHQ